MNSEHAADSREPSYTMGYSDTFQKMLHRRNAESYAAYLLPHLGPGLRVLDLGCGPGTISMGLAQAVAPGELHGIDLEESQIEMARARAAGSSVNAVFRTGDATDLPYEDETFDVAHGHALLMHVPDTEAVLAEVRRVLKPGGLVAARDMIGASSFSEPDFEGLSAVWTTFSNLLETNGAHPQMGKQLRGAFLKAGFSDVRAGASFECFSTDEDVRFFFDYAAGWFFSPATVEAATGRGLATREQFDDWRRAMERWKEAPGAFAAIAWGEATGRKP